MDTGTRRAAVRIVKRQERELKTHPAPETPPAAAERSANRTLAANVGSWIEEFRRRRERDAATFFNLNRLRAETE